MKTNELTQFYSLYPSSNIGQLRVAVCFIKFPVGFRSCPTLGPLMGGPQCRLSILRNGNDVPCHYYFSKIPCRF